MSFIRLSDAVGFLADSLDLGNPESIADVCSDAVLDAERDRVNSHLPSRRTNRLRAIHELARQHARQNLRLLYAGRDFPAGADHFTLGGHGAELGHIHIDFVRDDGAWTLKEIWICR